MKKKILLSTIVIAVVLVGIYIFTVVGRSNVSDEGTTQDIKQLVSDYSLGNLTAEAASIDSEQLIVTESDSNELTYDLPQDEFFVSIAPFVEQTHPCAIHSLTSCQGEMVEEEFNVYIEDTEGNVMVDETMKTMANGFIDLWLPRDETYNVTITQDGKSAESVISTFEGDNTCITTIQLAEKSA
ncbi:CueP family metal-binding protein [Oceanobacillus saliphilus]|uniref:CueP family metal-binding protein n=1 Tax=Oceanobacillus saliphilus TaxID=2925834 RepID=UPI00201E7472|nr:CueP family metal-binding protein [Oceanobacillus saliphilus]